MGNKIIHVEVVGKDGPALQKFYSDVFGWSLDTNNPDGYGMLRRGRSSRPASAPPRTAARDTSRSTSRPKIRRGCSTRPLRRAVGSSCR